MFNELAALQIGHCLTDLLVGVHDDRAVPRDWFFNRLSRDEEETHPFIACLNDNLIAAINSTSE